MDKSPGKQFIDLDLSIVKEEYGIQNQEDRKVWKVKFSDVKQLPKNPLLKSIQHKCSVCGKLFLNSSQLSIHQKTHSSLGALGDFNCPDCSRTFRFQQSLDEHRLRVHSSKSSLKCGKFDQLLARPTEQLNLNPQTTKKHPGKTPKVFECNECGKKFKSSTGMKAHVLLIHERVQPYLSQDKSFYCHECGSAFRTKESVAFHMDKHIKSIRCTKCPKTFRSKKKVFQHLKVFHGDDMSCDICTKKCLSVQGYWKHIQNHNKVIKPCDPDAKRLACPPCGKRFRNIDKLNAHVRNRKQFPCELCCLMVYERDRIKHIREFHGIPEEEKLKLQALEKTKFPMKCNGCGRKLRTEIHYKSHECLRDNKIKYERLLKYKAPEGIIRKEQEVQGDALVAQILQEVTKPIAPKMRFKCGICGQKFKTKDSVKMHIRKSHEQVDPYKVLTRDTEGLFQCDICLKKMPFNVLLEHLKQEGRTVFPCKHCGGLFLTLFDLKRHKALEREGAEMIYCPQCPLSFFFRRNLNYHMAREHLKVSKNFPCSICGRKFETYANLSSHTKRHKIEILMCEKCGNVYKGKSSLKRHIGVVHFGMPMSDFTGRKFPCGQCGRVLATRQALEHHVVTHIENRPMQCKYCSKTYKDRGALWTHINRIHTAAELEMKFEEGKQEIKIEPDVMIQEGDVKVEVTEVTKIVKMEIDETVAVKEECD